MTRSRAMRSLWGLPLLRSLRVRRAIWTARNGLLAARRAVFEQFGSDRHSRPALHGLDRALARHLPDRRGFFVEAGAYDGFIQSNTYWLERFRGWTGVLVEPVPHLWRQASRRRRGAHVVNCALVPRENGGRVRMRYGGLMSVVEGARGGAEKEAAHAGAGDMHGLDDVYEIEVPARTLTSVLEEAGAPAEIDLLSLDVEGFEAEVLRGLDLDRFRPRYVLVETDGVEERRCEIEAVLGPGYEMVEKVSAVDVLFGRRDG